MNKKMQYTKFKHLIVMVLTLFVAFGIAVGSKTFDVSAAEDIEEVTLHIEKRPVAGNTFKADKYNDICTIVTKDGDPETCEVKIPTEVNIVRWYHGRSTEDADKVKDGEEFKLNEEYTATVFLKAKSGYSWKKDEYNKVTSTINAMGGTVYNAYYMHDGEIAVSISFIALEGLKRIDVYVDEPVIGANPGTSYTVITEPADAFVAGKDPIAALFKTIADTTDEEFWEVSSTDFDADWKYMPTSATFEQGKYYRLHRSFVGFPGLIIAMGFEEYIKPEYSGVADGFEVYFNGVSAEDKDKAGKWALTTPISKVECKVKRPIEGAKPNYSPSFTGDDKKHLQFSTFVSGKVVMFDKIGWYKRGNNNKWYVMGKEETFEAGKEYEVALSVSAKWGYGLSSDTEYYVNGNKADHYKTITYVFTALPSVKELYFTVPEPVIGEKPGKVSLECDVENAITKTSVDALNVSGIWKVSTDGETYEEMKDTDTFEAGKYYRNDSPSLWLVAALLIEPFDGSMFDENYAGGSTLSAKVFVNGKERTEEGETWMSVDFGKLEAPATPTPTPTPTPEPTPVAPTVSPDGIAAEGTELAALDEAILAKEDDKDLPGAIFGQLQAKASKVAKKSITLKWNTIEGADGYVIYGNKCGNANKYEKIKELTAGKKSFTQKKLKKGTYYKYLIVAYKNVDGKQLVVSTSKTIHAATTGGKVGNAKSITIKNLASKKKTLKVGKKFTLKTKQVPKDAALKIKNHRKISYESSDKAVATVSSKGKIKAVGPGTCYIYVYAQNGVSTKVKIKVK